MNCLYPISSWWLPLTWRKWQDSLILEQLTLHPLLVVPFSHVTYLHVRKGPDWLLNLLPRIMTLLLLRFEVNWHKTRAGDERSDVLHLVII